MIERGVDHERVDAPASLPDGRYVALRLERVQLVATIGCSLLFTTTRRSAQPGGACLVAGRDTPRPLAIEVAVYCAITKAAEARCGACYSSSMALELHGRVGECCAKRRCPTGAEWRVPMWLSPPTRLSAPDPHLVGFLPRNRAPRSIGVY